MWKEDVKLILAPMAGVCDLPFRIICEQWGADATVSEMVSAKALTYGDKKTEALMDCSGQEKPCAIQLFGHEPEVMERAARLVAGRGVRWVDLNMGCPAPKIVKSGDGSALMRDPGLVGEVTAAVRAGLPEEVCLSVKLRAGFTGEERTVAACARAAARAGANFLTVHGRTRDQFYAPPVDLGSIREAKEAAGVPVVGNGDVEDGPSAERMLRETGCDALMIGRAALGRPDVFGEVRAYLRGEPRRELSLAQRFVVCQEHIRLLVEKKGEKGGMLEARKHLAWYFKGLRGGAKLRAAAHGVTEFSEVAPLLERALALQREE